MGAPLPSLIPPLGRLTPSVDLRSSQARQFFDLDFDTMQTVLTAARYGDTTGMVDLWLRMVSSDDQIQSTRETRLAPIYSTHYEVHPGSPRSPDAVRLADLCRQAIDQMESRPQAFAHLTDARFTGFQVCEIDWGRVETGLGRKAWLPVDLPGVHARRFRFNEHGQIGLYDEGRAVYRMREMGWKIGEDFDLLPGSVPNLVRLKPGKYIVHQPISIADYPGGRGLVFPLARWWWAKLVGMRYWLQGAEIAANPRLIGELPQTADESVFDELETGLERLSSEGVIIVRNGAKVTIQDSQGQVSGDVWNKLLGRMNAAISKIILGSTLNVEIDSAGGNRAAAESQDDTTIRPRQQADSQQLCSTMQRQLFRLIRDFNVDIVAADTPLPIMTNRFIEHSFAAGAQVSTDDSASVEVTTEAPKPEGVSQAAEVDVADTAYTGIQTEKGTAIIERVIAGQLPRSTAVELLVAFFQMERTRAQQIVDSVPVDFRPANPVDAEHMEAPL